MCTAVNIGCHTPVDSAGRDGRPEPAHPGTRREFPRPGRRLVSAVWSIHLAFQSPSATTRQESCLAAGNKSITRS